ncbi:unnamed protein product [Miscanthus lutarioriparius]|uniref:Endonuclease/exonuclease/phosphatase domain-containing protein n=1 Tax=Miscanthus lutarioriparius TaxID=422564 RepID=A0A811N2F9_9POAL|nr:unnamed protein product [Miscanthus lutarioriparius]
MARPGDPSVRPLDTCAVAFSIDDMDHELDRLSMHGMVAWLGGGNRPVVEPEVIKRAICHHFPGSFPYRNLDIHTRPWQLVTHGDICDLKYRVRLCLEGIPLHTWNENIAKRAIARACDLDYVEKSSLDREDTRALSVWAWTHNPSDIPKVTWLTLSCRKAEFHSTPAARGRRGLTFRVLVHLDLVEDPPGRDGRAAAPRDYTWHYGVVDGERTLCDRHDPPPAGVRGSRRDDDDDRRGRRERQGDNWGPLLVFMAQLNCQILNWNVRGMNDGARQDSVSELVRSTGATIVCLQEIKMQVMDHNVVSRTAGAKFVNSYIVLPAEQTRGGILLAVNEDFFDLSDVELTTNAITAQITMRADGIKWQITVVYGPQGDAAKLQFLQELKKIPPPEHNRWLILGDFNLIY